MKKYLTLLCAFALIIFSCEQEENNQNKTYSFELNKDLKFESLANSIIGHEKNGKVVLGVSDQKVMETFKSFAKVYGLELKPQSFNVVIVDDEYYLRFYSDNNLVSTIALLKNDNDQFLTGPTVCTSEACASCCGCVPQGNYCSECKPNEPFGPSGDCKRTTTSIDPGT